MADIETYLEAANRASTKRTYAGAVRHFEIEAGRPLPATGAQVAQYLADYAGQLAVPTLRHRLAALAQWHGDQGFAEAEGGADERGEEDDQQDVEGGEIHEV